ncbi:hypothetical protein LJ656_29210 [Paraburkholderia sp. MMS20-SJTR3]|uniref:Uncharacterized protein n=1 Tax=Paraburkholderia sejongensis TaxID=2886946 RepID=A0ABS8K3W7_9BURK|nr:hypothetical protein [Paraburkholderia sp. MMS20-SJTR3]MCC8396675.1 hypothetical protein [Paraburkholderia sp. MMS20-SJTR3]
MEIRTHSVNTLFAIILKKSQSTKNRQWITAPQLVRDPIGLAALARTTKARQTSEETETAELECFAPGEYRSSLQANADRATQARRESDKRNEEHAGWKLFHRKCSQACG